MTLGVDIVLVSRVERLLERHGARFLERNFSPAEVADCAGRPERVASRWAAKEAVIKALSGSGLSLFPRQVEVHSNGGPPAVTVSVPGAPRVELSLTHDAGVAVAVALAGALPAAPARALIEVPSPEIVLPERPDDGHKGTFGTVAVIAGSLGYTGAAYLCSMGAARGGAGIVRLMVADSIFPILAAKCSEVIVTPVTEVAPGVIGHFAVEEVLRQLDGARAGLIGPGLGRDLANRRLILEVLLRASCPLVIDADALNALSDNQKTIQRLGRGHVLTPHPGEMSRLTGIPRDQIQQSRREIALRFAREWKQVVVLKGAETVIAGPDGALRVDGHRSAALASGGTGDVLAGLIASYLAQGLSAFDAAVTGVYVHAEAGRRLTEDLGDAGVLASDLLPEIPRVVRWLKSPDARETAPRSL
ncbi:MAG: NAD(P)H-hydrate dehydratase [Candidatus Dormibacteria bacterium]